MVRSPKRPLRTRTLDGVFRPVKQRKVYSIVQKRSVFNAFCTTGKLPIRDKIAPDLIDI